MISSKLGPLRLGFMAVLLLFGACADTDDATMGTARVKVTVDRAAVAEITRLTVEANGVASDLTPDPVEAGTFTGSLTLPPGPAVLIGRAFAGDSLVGESNPVNIDVIAGQVISASIRILDITGGDKIDHGPIIAALIHPMQTFAKQEVSLSAQIVDPDDDPVAVQWTDDCDDATFTAPQAAATGWSKETPGNCRITVTATAKELSVSATFTIFVFAEGGNNGIVDVDGEFIAAPNIELIVQYDNTACFVNQNEAFNATCPDPIASPQLAFIDAAVFWDKAIPGTIEITDDCGGTFNTIFSDEFGTSVAWLPPTEFNVCLISANAVSGEGIVSETSAALLVTAGTPVQPPVIKTIDISANDGSICESTTPVACTVELFTTLSMQVVIDDSGLIIDTMTLSTDCESNAFEIGSDENFARDIEWQLFETGACTLTIELRDLAGFTSATNLTVQVVDSTANPAL